MFLNGYTYEEYIPEKINYPNKINNVPDLGEIDTILDNFLNLWLKPPYIKKCKEILKTRISKSLKHQFLVEKLSNKKIFLIILILYFQVLCRTFTVRSLCSVANKKNIPIIAFHHGVTHEISDTIKINYPLYDANFADFTITHTDLGALAVKDQPYKRASVKAIGLPSRALRLKTLKKLIIKFL